MCHSCGGTSWQVARNTPVSLTFADIVCLGQRVLMNMERVGTFDEHEQFFVDFVCIRVIAMDAFCVQPGWHYEMNTHETWYTVVAALEQQQQHQPITQQTTRTTTRGGRILVDMFYLGTNQNNTKMVGRLLHRTCWQNNIRREHDVFSEIYIMAYYSIRSKSVKIFMIDKKYTCCWWWCCYDILSRIF